MVTFDVMGGEQVDWGASLNRARISATKPKAIRRGHPRGGIGWRKWKGGDFGI